MAVIPAYQAEWTIGPLVQRVLALGMRVIVVDDASADRTADEAQAAGAQVLSRRVNGGKGAAFRDGVAEALKSDWDWLLTLDADGQHLASEIPAFLEAAEKGEPDLLVGNRMGRPRRMPLDRRLTNRFLSWLIFRITGRWVPDTQCGFRLIRRRVLERVALRSDRFEIESEMVVRSVRAGFRVESVPVTCVYRREISFIRPLRDTGRFLCFLWRLKRDRPA